jgi:hypothetical protein
MEASKDRLYSEFPKATLLSRYECQGGRTGLVGAEVGVLHGQHAENLLTCADVRMLYLVDPYKECPDFKQETLDFAREAAKTRLRRFKR